MKVKCSRGQLADAFSIAQSVVPPRTTIPAITCVKLTAQKDKSGGTLELACTDMEFGLKYSLPAAEVKEEGTLVLPAQRMAGILRESGDDERARRVALVCRAAAAVRNRDLPRPPRPASLPEPALRRVLGHDRQRRANALRRRTPTPPVLRRTRGRRTSSRGR